MASEDQGPLVNTLVWIFTAVAAVFVGLRLISRIKIKSNPGWDDLAISVALAMDVAYSIVISIAVSKGTGTHEETLPGPEAKVEAGYWNVVAIEIGIFSFGLPKVAISLLLGRILKISRRLCWLLYALAGILILYALIQDIVFIEQCHPVSGAWNRGIQATCWDPWPITVSGIFYSSLSAFLDLFYAILPVAIISSLNMDRRRKIGLCIMMSLGIVAGAVGFYKCSKLPALASPKTDFTWATAPLLYWSSIEANCVIIAACVPTIHPFTQLVVSRVRSHFSSGPYYNAGDRRVNRSAITDPNKPLQSQVAFAGSEASNERSGSSRGVWMPSDSERQLDVQTSEGSWHELSHIESSPETAMSSLGKHTVRPPADLTYNGQVK